MSAVRSGTRSTAASTKSARLKAIPIRRILGRHRRLGDYRPSLSVDAQAMRSFDGDWVDGRAAATGERDRRRFQQKVVFTVGRAVGGEVLEVEVLALCHPHVAQLQQMDGK